ncbi:MAG: hypothetical protein HY001_03500 [Candidatus Portnoybacteria bacterium]|nr:hypothetical protein [Candidatus Portnoybacteria bacterium]
MQPSVVPRGPVRAWLPAAMVEVDVRPIVPALQAHVQAAPVLTGAAALVHHRVRGQWAVTVFAIAVRWMVVTVFATAGWSMMLAAYAAGTARHVNNRGQRPIILLLYTRLKILKVYKNFS